jgi:tRNA threonylcarbamoyl adenosine modification protein YeaZ
MRILAIELSADPGSVALLEGNRVVVSLPLPRAQGRAAVLFDALARMQNETGCAWDSIDLFAAGRGPGRYAGMRVALTTVQHLALPGNKPVRAVSSGWALAASMEPAPDQPVAVLGDARRERVWCGLFTGTNTIPRPCSDWQLIALADIGEQWREQAAHGATPALASVLATLMNVPLLSSATPLLVSPEWERLLPLLQQAGIVPAATGRRTACPDAAWVGRLAYAEAVQQWPAQPVTPIYMHPPVAV